MVKAFGYRSHGGPEVDEFLDLETPHPFADELLIEVHAAGVNPVDWKLRSGMYGPGDLPAVLGQEAAGVVREVGQDVEGFAVGDEVFGACAPGSGGYAEYTLLTADLTAHKPPDVSWTDAATLTVAAATAYDGVTQLQLKPGQSLLINGISGGVGVAAAQIARDQDINVIGTASADKRELVESLDATLIPYDQDAVAQQIRQLLPDGVDAILDLAGGDGLRAVADLVTDRSKLISAGDMSVNELGGHMIERNRNRRVLDTVAGLVAEGKLDPHVEDQRSLDEAAAALAAVETGHAKGKVVLQLS
jgi:NADPH2:quinone reductase